MNGRRLVGGRAAPARLALSAAALAAALGAGSRAHAFRVWTIPFITESLPTAGLRAHIHWDLREFPNCQVPFAISNANMPDLDGNGTPNQAADRTAATNAITASFAAWTNVAPAIIALTHQPTALQANTALTLDNVNVVGFGTGAGDDRAHGAPVGTAGHGANAVIIIPGADGVLNSVPAAGDNMAVVGGVSVIRAGADGDVDTTPAGDDAWAFGLNVGANVRIITPGANTTFESIPFGDDAIAAGFITAGADGIVDSSPNSMTVTNTSTFGITGMLVNNVTGVIQESDIVLNTTSMIADETNTMRPVPWVIGTQRIHDPFNAQTPGPVMMIPYNKDLQATTTHELGHAIGISHPEENQLIAVGNGSSGQVCISGAGVGGALSAATMMAIMGDDEADSAGRRVYTGADGICQTTAQMGDTQNVMVGRGRSIGASGGFFAVTEASDGVRTTMAVPDDMLCGPGMRRICVGADGLAQSGQAMNVIPTMNTNPNAFTGNAPAEQSLAQDDQDACNFLYTWDLGDAHDPFLAGGNFNEYQTLVQNTTNSGRTLNGVMLKNPGLGPVHLLGHNRTGGVFRFEWLGANEDGNANEHAPIAEDMFDDGLAIKGVPQAAIGALGQGFTLVRGGTYDFVVTISHTNQAGRYAAAQARRLYFNGYIDFKADRKFTIGDDLEIWWSGTPTATSSSSSNLFATSFAGPPVNTVTLTFRLTVPANAANPDETVPIIFSRMRLDYGEDESARANTSGNLGFATGVAQFGEVEDYLIAFTDKPDQLHMHCLPEYTLPSIPLLQSGTMTAVVELDFMPMSAQAVTFRQVAGPGAIRWPDGSVSATTPEWSELTGVDGRASVQVSDTGANPGDVLIEITVAGTDLVTYCHFDTGFIGVGRSPDLNDDGVVDTADLGILLGVFGEQSTVADINGDGVVDTSDLGLLLAAFQ